MFLYNLTLSRPSAITVSSGRSGRRDGVWQRPLGAAMACARRQEAQGSAPGPHLHVLPRRRHTQAAAAAAVPLPECCLPAHAHAPRPACSCSPLQCAIYGSFSEKKVHELVVSRGRVLELLRPDDSGKVQVVHSTDVFGVIRSLAPFRCAAGGDGPAPAQLDA